MPINIMKSKAKALKSATATTRIRSSLLKRRRRARTVDSLDEILVAISRLAILPSSRSSPRMRSSISSNAIRVLNSQGYRIHTISTACSPGGVYHLEAPSLLEFRHDVVAGESQAAQHIFVRELAELHETHDPVGTNSLVLTKFPNAVVGITYDDRIDLFKMLVDLLVRDFLTA